MPSRTRVPRNGSLVGELTMDMDWLLRGRSALHQSDIPRTLPLNLAPRYGSQVREASGVLGFLISV